MQRDTATCIRCQSDLEKTNGRSIGAALACSLATLLLLVPVNVLPLLRVDIFRMHSQNLTAVGVAELWGHGWILLAGLSALFVILFPFLRFGLLSAVLAALRLGRRPSWLGTAFRWSLWLDPWAMIDVYLLAGCIGYFRLINIDQARLTIEPGGACFIAAAFLTMLSRAMLDVRTVWRAIGGETRVQKGEAVVGCTTCDLVLPLSREGQRCPREPLRAQRAQGDRDRDARGTPDQDAENARRAPATEPDPVEHQENEERTGWVRAHMRCPLVGFAVHDARGELVQHRRDA